MTQPPKSPKIYHITHVDNLSTIAKEGMLVSDREMIRRGGPIQPVGMSGIKKRRVEEIEVSCHQGTMVGDYVPFYFCPRSIMLYVISCANHPELTYQGGQEPIVHLEADLYRVIRWADEQGVRWAFSLSNAGARYAEFQSSIDRLDMLDWSAISARDFSEQEVKEGKQAEFLLHERFPIDLVDQIGVQSALVNGQATDAIREMRHHPKVSVIPEWYF